MGPEVVLNLTLCVTVVLSGSQMQEMAVHHESGSGSSLKDCISCHCYLLNDTKFSLLINVESPQVTQQSAPASSHQYHGTKILVSWRCTNKS